MAKRKQKSPYKKEPLKGLSTKQDINLPIETTFPKTHPTDIEEGFIERMVKKAAMSRGAFLEEDEPYLEQYLHPDRDILEKTSERPSLGGLPTRSMEYRKLHKFPATYTQDEGYNVEGLGNFKYDKSNPNYDSVYDTWDFDTESGLTDPRKPEILPSLSSMENWIAKEAMKRVGRPYTVYERVPKGTDVNKWRTGK